MDKLRLGIFKYTCCAGCEFQLLFFQEHVLKTLDSVEIVYCKMERSGGVEKGPFDLALIEGAITESYQADQLKAIREQSTYLIPIGSCAVNGGIPAIKNSIPELEAELRVYTDVSNIHSMKTMPVDEYVNVDGYLKGCPVGDKDLWELLISLLDGREPSLIKYCVCVECKLNGNICLLVADKKPCMGPVTNAGCGALCPSRGRACYSCWGPVEGANAQALAREFECLGLTSEEIVRKFTLFGSAKVEFWRVGELYESR